MMKLKEDGNVGKLTREESPTIEFDYVNYRGEFGHRRVKCPDFGCHKTEWHPDSTILIRAYDLDKQDFRLFDPAKITNWREIQNVS
jgi:predicted DNA-binding transcriptional regulator YafY